VLKLNVFEKSSRNKARRWLGFFLGLMFAPAFNVWADPTLTYSNVFSFDLTTPGAGTLTELSVGGVDYLYGTVINTSRTYGGVIYRVNSNGGAPETIYQLSSSDGYKPDAALLVGNDPNDGTTYLYGMTTYWPPSSSSTANGTGTLFRVTPNGSRFQTLHVFAAVYASNTSTNADGIYPAYGLIDGSDGYLYGVTTSGGTYGNGTIFRIKLDGNDFQVLHSFSALNSDLTNSDGATPSAALTIGPGGRLYGVTSAGGSNAILSSSTPTAGTGVVFSLNTDGSDFQTIYNFPELDTSGTGRNDMGATPKSTLLYDLQSNLLIGTASQGGSPIDTSSAGLGTIFSIRTDGTPNGTTATLLHSFTGTDGESPYGRLVAGADGLIYGITDTGTNSTTAPYTNYGSVYTIDTLGNFNIAIGFTTSNPTQVTGLVNGLIQASDGNFYGVGTSAGACGSGALFRLSLTGSTTTSPYSNCTNQSSSSGGGSMSNGWVWLLCALGLAPPVRRRLFGFN